MRGSLPSLRQGRYVPFAFSLALFGGTAHAAEFFVDPVAGSTSGDGSASQPWLTVEGVVQAGHFGKTIHAGDTVWLKTGYHGAMAISGGTYAPPISNT